ncbi:beach-domain-containing protein [Lentinula raphanica]|nr:beach-domain-containing protein [Lentinula raphanica]
MFKTLLTPLRAKFNELSPLSPSANASHSGLLAAGGDDDENDSELAPEDFARDVLIELMRNSVENLKSAEEVGGRIEVLSEIKRIMDQEPQTKDVFRELDGFLVLLNVLSTVQHSNLSSNPDTSPSPPTLITCIRLVFILASTALSSHPQNTEYFKLCVGYDSFRSAIEGLVTSTVRLREVCLGLLLGFALGDLNSEDADVEELVLHVDEGFPAELERKLVNATIRRPEAVYLLWRFLITPTTTQSSASPLHPMSSYPASNFTITFPTLKLLDVLASANHRNRAILSVGEVIRPLLVHYRTLCRDLQESRHAKGTGTEEMERTKKEKALTQKLLKKLLEMGASPAIARGLFQRVTNLDIEIDTDILDLLRSSMKSRWVEHFSLTGRAGMSFQTPPPEKGYKSSKGVGVGLPPTGFTFMIWLWVETLPPAPLPGSNTPSSSPLFTARLSPSSYEEELISLRLTHNGKLELISAGNSNASSSTSESTLLKKKWTHLTLVHYPGGGLFVDGALSDTIDWPYPANLDVKGSALSPSLVEYDTNTDTMSWCIASSYLVALPLADDLPRFIHHLGPRYFGSFQDTEIARFLTYEAATSLNMFVFNAGAIPNSNFSGTSSMLHPPPGPSSLIRAIKEGIGMGVPESGIVWAVSPWNCEDENEEVEEVDIEDMQGQVLDFVMHGDVYFVKAKTMDSALFRVGGVGIALKLVGAAKTSHELSRALGVFTDGIKNSWQNSEDVERLRGYDILADILRSKAGMINMTSFETIFEFLGMNFRCPDQSTVTNPPAYLSLALDFELWSLTPSPIHQVFFEHFSILLETSRWRAFNLGIYKRIGKGNAGLVRRLLFVLKMGWFESSGNKNLKDSTSLTFLLDALKSAAKALWTKDEGIKPLVSYLAANLHDGYEDPKNEKEKEEGSGPNSRNREKAEQVLVILTSILRSPQSSLPSPSPNSSPAPFPSFSLANTSSPYPYLKLFLTNLPLTRILLLLLGPRPSPVIASQILTIIGICVSPSDGTGTGKEVGFVGFGRKFELVGGWGVLRAVLSSEGGKCWNKDVNKAAFDVMLGRVSMLDENGTRNNSEENVVTCPQMAPIILSAMSAGLGVVAKECFEVTDDTDGKKIQSTIESLIETLLSLHSSSPTFRFVFQSQQTTAVFVGAYRAFPDSHATVNPQAIRILEKLSHFGLGLALDNSVAGGQKREILDILQSAEAIINPTAERTNIDPGLVQDTRSIRQRLASGSAGLSLLSLGTGTGMSRGNGLQFVGDRTVMKTLNRMYEWRKTIRESEKKRVRKEVLDLRETRRQISRLYDHTLTPTNIGERELWGKLIEKRVGRSRLRRLWRLDETEGPHRIRKKLEPDNNTSDASNTSNASGNNPSFSNARGTVAVDPEAEAGASGTVDVPPWAESYEVSSTDMDDRQLAEEIAEDKHRRVRHELEPGDVIECVGTVARVAGVDSSPGLLILGRTHVYMLDGLVENSDGEVIEAHDAPKSLFFVPGSIVELDGPQRAHRWSHEQIATFGSKTFLFRDVALEIYFKDSRSLLVVFIDKQKRSEINQRLTNIVSPTLIHSQSVARTPLLGGIFSGLWTDADELSTAQRRWQAREISNFTYLCVLNQVSGRTPSDATQYPVFPWVLQDYTSSTLDLSNPESFRDLTKPMGAQTPARQEAASTRYANLSSVDEKPFHYGTHFSSSMIVCHFLIRMAPFTNMFKTLQGGDWDLPDRLFSDISRAYESAARDIRGDVRELIPEFFNVPEFLENSSDLDFGVQQNTGERIHDVKLPPWAKQDPLLFIIMNRRALESPHVSENLPAWIDLIWGYKQRDPASLNVFHPLSYEGSIDLDSITDELEREATVGIIHNFGQTPRKLFTTPHPQRYNHGLHTLPIGTLHGVEEDAHLLVQGSRCIKDLGPTTPITALALDMVGEKILPCPPGVLYVPAHPHEQISWTPSHTGTKEIRVSVDSKVVQIIEGSLCSCAAFADANVLVTGSSDWSVRIWRLSRGGGGSGGVGGGGTPLSISQAHIMRIHTDEVVSVAACRAWSVIVSGSRDGSAALWDLNRAVYVRSIWHDKRGGEMAMVSLIDINESTGYIATCSHQKLCLHTINARPIAVLDLTTLPNYTALRPPITSMAFHEREYSHLGVLATGGSDGIITLRTWSVDNTPEGEKARWEFVTLRAMKVRAPVGRGIAPSPAVTALKFLGESLCHGEETGKSYVWSLPD